MLSYMSTIIGIFAYDRLHLGKTFKQSYRLFAFWDSDEKLISHCYSWYC